MSNSRTLLIFGGTQKLVLSLAREAARRRLCVAVACPDRGQEEAIMSTLASFGCERMFIKTPLREEIDFRRAIERVIRRWGSLDTVVNVASHASIGLFETSNTKDWQWSLENNLVKVIHGCKAAISPMKRQGYGQLLNITSQNALLSQPSLAVFNATHAAIVSLSETLHSELSPLGINVSVACADFFDGLLHDEWHANTPLDAARFERLQAGNSLSSEDVAKQIFQGLEKRKFLILTHPEGRRRWRLYRWRYTRYLQLLRQSAEKIRPENRFFSNRKKH